VRIYLTSHQYDIFEFSSKSHSLCHLDKWIVISIGGRRRTMRFKLGAIGW